MSNRIWAGLFFYVIIVYIQNSKSAVRIIMKYVFLLGLFLWSIEMNAQVQIAAYKTLPLKTIDDRLFISSKTKKAYTVFVFWGPECPFSQNYTLTLNQLYKKYGIPYPLIKDENMRLVSVLGATVTPEVFLLDSSGNLLYNGAIDDWAVSLGKTRKRPTANYLENAINNTLHQTLVTPAFVKPVGCYIENENE